LPFVDVLRFVPLAGMLMITVCVITGLYVLAAEGTKHWFFRSGLAAVV